MKIKFFFHQDTFSFSYIVYDQATKDAILIDPVLDYEQAASCIKYDYVKELADFILQEALLLHWIIETHIHADHISGAQYFKEKFSNSKIGISSKVVQVQKTFCSLYNLAEIATDGSQFDRLFEDGEIHVAGSLNLKFIHTPGHTPSCMSIHISNCLFVGDSLFIPDFGTGRCDFPDGSASELYSSVHDKIYQLPDQTRLFVGHDYQPGGRPLRWETSIAESKKENIQLCHETTKKDFIEFRTARDKSLNAPKLLLASLQININAGILPKVEDNDKRYLKIPLTLQK
jgi:glyoxylase-like metal-dependent hydrolase (beta-lactamase superfamily II)